MTTGLHLTHTDVPKDARILRELNALSERMDLDVNAYGVLESGAPKAPVPYTLTEFRVRSSRVVRLPRPVRYALVMPEVNTQFLLRLLKLRPDIVHCHDTMVLPCGVLAEILLRSTLVYDAHELESDKGGQSGTLSKATLWIEKAGWSRIDYLITVSPSIADRYAEQLGPKPTACILDSPELSATSGQPTMASRPGLREQLGIDFEAPRFVYVGALEIGRGIELILAAFAEGTAEVHVAFIGSGDLEDTLDRATELQDNIHRCLPVPHDQLVDFIREATGGFSLIEDVSLSDHYCLPNKLFEYAFAGLPVIASRLPDIERYVDDYQLGVCADLDAEYIRAAARTSVTQPRNLPLNSSAIAQLGEPSQRPQGHVGGTRCGPVPVKRRNVPRLAIGPLNTAGQAFQWAQACRTHGDFEAFSCAGSRRSARRITGLSHRRSVHHRVRPTLLKTRWTKFLLRNATHFLDESFTPITGDLRTESLQRDLPWLRDAVLSVGVLFRGSDIRSSSRHIETRANSYFRLMEPGMLAPIESRLLEPGTLPGALVCRSSSARPTSSRISQKQRGSR